MTSRPAILLVAVLACGCFVKAPPYQGPFAHWMLVEASATTDGSAPRQELSRQDCKEIATVVPGVELVIPARLGTASVTSKESQDATVEVEISGSTPEMLDLIQDDNRVVVVAGRFLLAREPEPVAVITQDLAARLFPSDDPVGKSLTIGPHELTVAGVIEYGETSWTGRTHPSMFVPQAAFDMMDESLTLRSTSEVDQIWISNPDLLRVVDSQRIIERVLAKNHPGQSFHVRVGMRSEQKEQ